MPKPKTTTPSGVIILDKPRGPTSTACLNRIKSRFKLKKIGHAGTLDPIARGILVVLLGQATKLSSYFTEGAKTYYGTIRLGLSTDTYDTQGTVLERGDYSGLSREIIGQEIESWTELKEQSVPPMSAAKHQGKPLYALSRAGQEVPHKTKRIVIHQAEALNIEPPEVEFRITCSSGTYVRSLAHSLGTRLGCHAVLADLVREYSHPFGLEQAVELDTLLDSQNWEQHVCPIPRALAQAKPWPQLVVSRELARMIRNGQPVSTHLLPEYQPREEEMALLLTQEHSPLALVQAQKWEGRLVWSIIRGLWA